MEKSLVSNYKELITVCKKIPVQYANCDECIFNNTNVARTFGVDCKLGASNRADYIKLGCSSPIHNNYYNFIKRPLKDILKNL